MEEMREKLERLKQTLKGYGGAAVAFSGGVDSTFLLKVAHDTLGARCVAVTVRSRLFPRRELEEAAAFCAKVGVRQFAVEADGDFVEGIAHNPVDRCYICKRGLFGLMLNAAAAEGMSVVCEGSNTDDTGDYRPGLKAVAELGIQSPLRGCGLSKREIRALSAEKVYASIAPPDLWNRRQDTGKSAAEILAGAFMTTGVIALAIFLMDTVLDIEKFAKVAHANGIPLIVDNTFSCNSAFFFTIECSSVIFVIDNKNVLYISLKNFLCFTFI